MRASLRRHQLGRGAVASRSRGCFLVFIVVAAATVLLPSRARAQCVDEALKQQLVGRRAYRGVVPRLFKKALRHEISPMGGWLAADLADSAPIYGGAYTFHFTEDLGLEASYFRYRQSYDLLNEIADRNQGLVLFQRAPTETVQLFMGNLVWSMAYGKVRWFGGPIGRFDFYLSLGAGATDERNTRAPTGSGGIGLKFYLTEWLALRFDVRDYVHKRAVPSLPVEKIVNDISTTGGFSVFLPFKS